MKLWSFFVGFPSDAKGRPFVTSWLSSDLGRGQTTVKLISRDTYFHQHNYLNLCAAVSSRLKDVSREAQV